IAGQSDAQSGAMSIRELERLRDDNLVGMMRALKKSGSGAGGVLNLHEAGLPMPQRAAALPVTADRQIPQSWTDYNGHMNEAHYLEASAAATDRFMEMIGADADYIASGKSYFTVENHIRYIAELLAGEQLTIETQVLGGTGKKLHLFHLLYGPERKLAATAETLLLHVDLTTRATSEPDPTVIERLAKYSADHANLPVPEGAGRHVGQRP
ncbi:MAG: thioesterase family protein, partial [Pseudomonadota bacterium]